MQQENEDSNFNLHLYVDAIAKAIANAKKNLVEVDMVDGTVPYDLKVKYKAARVMLHPASK